MHHQNAKLFPEVSLTLNKDWGNRNRKREKIKEAQGKSSGKAGGKHKKASKSSERLVAQTYSCKSRLGCPRRTVNGGAPRKYTP